MSINLTPFSHPTVMPEVEALSRPFGAQSLAGTRPGLYRNVVKRVLDILLTLLAAPVVVPAVIVLALLISTEGVNPFYSQLRIGKNGRAYRMWKLRTMVSDADARLEHYLAAHPELRSEWDQKQKLVNDPRITRFGQFLRNSSIDELPQLWNVLIGDMALVGPRPMMLSQRSLYPSTGYFALRPGITGNWQISGRNKTTFAARAIFDDAYERELTLAVDADILVRTVSVVLRGTGY